MNCFNCEMETACKTWFDLISQKKTYSIDITLLKKRATEVHQMLPYYKGEYEPKQKNIDFESVR